MPKDISNYSLQKNIWRTLGLYWQIDSLALIGYLFLIALQVTSSILAIYFGSRIIGQLTLVFQNKTVSSGHVYILLAASTIAVLGERFSWRWISFIERRAWIKWYVRMTVDFNSAISSLDMEQHDNFDLKKRFKKFRKNINILPKTSPTTSYSAYIQLLDSCHL